MVGNHLRNKKLCTVSVVMPAFNGGKYISRAIDSILSQVYTDFELIIVDDASTDNTLEIIKSYPDSRIKVYRNDINRGISYSTNFAIEASCGRYVALMDDDDVSIHDRLFRQVEYMESNQDIDVLGGKTIYIDADDEEVRRDTEIKLNPRYYKALLLFQNTGFANSTVMYRRSFIDKYKIRYRENLCGMQDFLFYVECSKYGNISALDSWLLRHRLHDGKETEKQRKNNSEERNRVYGNIQMLSIQSSGFDLEGSDYNLIITELREMPQKCESVTQWIKLGCVLKKMIVKADRLQIDYKNELVHVCRFMMSKRFAGLDIFNCPDGGLLWDIAQ